MHTLVHAHTWQRNPDDRALTTVHYAPRGAVPVFADNVMYKCSNRASYFRGEQADGLPGDLPM